jgi:L-seryl-tRNA(Ser) seleniumtransferase
MKSEPRRLIPSVEKVLLKVGPTDLPRPVLVAMVRRQLAGVRASKGPITTERVMTDLQAAIVDLRRTRIQPVINGTGIIIHTNLGRSPLAGDVVNALTNIALHYNNLEYDLNTGDRGGRAAYLEHNLAILCGAEAATVVNNCAAALVLILRHFTGGARKEVTISRGELVQIGGGFRISEILEASGAKLREVGSTNKTALSDYSRAISKQTAMILKVHRSNFYMGGFVDSPPTESLADLARKKRVPLVEDLGSGATIATETIEGLEHEPTPAQTLKRGVDLVCFSGDKLLGGPQAGIVAGKAKLVAALKREPLFRALRCDKLILSALQVTVDLQLSDPAAVPIVSMLREPLESLRARALMIQKALAGLPAKTEVRTGKSQVGGGTLPKSTIQSITLDLVPTRMALPALADKLRRGIPPVIGYISGGGFRLDLRTVFPRQDESLLSAIRTALA